MYEFGVGIDIHKSFLHVAVCTGTAVVTQRQFGWSDEALTELKALIRQHCNVVIAMEACTGAKHLSAQLADLDVPVVVVDGRSFRQRFPKMGKKTVSAK